MGTYAQWPELTSKTNQKIKNNGRREKFKRWKIIRKWAFRALCLLAVIMAVLVALVYTIG